MRRKATVFCHVLQWPAASLLYTYNFGMLPSFGGVQFFVIALYSLVSMLLSKLTFTIAKRAKPTCLRSLTKNFARAAFSHFFLNVPRGTIDKHLIF